MNTATAVTCLGVNHTNTVVTGEVVEEEDDQTVVRRGPQGFRFVDPEYDWNFERIEYSEVFAPKRD